MHASPLESEESCSWLCVNASSVPLVRWLVICIEVVCSMCSPEMGEESSRERCLLRCCSYIERIPAEGLNNGTCCFCVACIGDDTRLRTGWISSPVRAVTFHRTMRYRSWSLCVLVLCERGGRRILTLALSRHMVGRTERGGM